MARRQATEELVYLPLGGAGEIGMNLYLYGTGPADARKWIIVDLGIGFADETLPGIDVVVPDITFLEAERNNILAVVLTHAHEDHFGALATLWPRLEVPVYATPFTAAMLRVRLDEQGFGEDFPLHVVDLGAHFELGPFNIEYITVTHSIPEPNALLITTAAGRVLHTGDWKIDDRPVLGAPTDEARMREIGAEGVDAMICDSTNVFREGTSASETDVAAHLAEIIAGAAQRVAVTTFSSNVARILSLARAAHAAGREVVVAGRALHRVIAVARETGWLEGAGQFHDQNVCSDLPRDKVLVMLTGSQGEPRAALSRVARDSHPNVALEEGDLVIFSSKTIPGNEKPVSAIENRLVARGIEVIDADRHLVHVTGHPRRDELGQMYDWVRPDLSIPMHGEMRHLHEHAALARQCGVKNAMVVANGTMVRLAPGPAEVIDETASGRILRDGNLLIREDDPAVRDRRRLSQNGAVFIALVTNQRGDVLVDPDFEIIGLPALAGDGREIAVIVEDTIDAAIDALPGPRRRDPDHLAEMVRRAVRSTLDGIWGKKTDCRVSVTQV
ncbi:MAG: ribonuclease J [Rhizobiales bacterium]|nr:ribonuclease J [Hyphomicrobiales bacterium]